MSSHHTTTFADRERFVQLHREGWSYPAIAKECGWKASTVKKHCLAYQDQAESAFQPKPPGPAPSGILSSFDPIVRFAILRVKRQHCEWGAPVVLDEVAQRASVKGRPSPKASQTAEYFHQFGNRLVRPQRNLRPPPPIEPVPEGREAVVFQLDMQERLHLEKLGYFNVVSIRAPKWGITVGYFPHQAGEKRWERKVSQAEAREDCRSAFETWGLPDILQTDLDKVLVCSDESPFPTDFVLFHVGLGIFHRPIRRVTQNASVERSHRTFDKQMLSGVATETWADFLTHVQSELTRLTERIPSRANACHGQIPIQAHPEALTPKRPYRRNLEDQLFDMQRVYRYLAGGKWVRHTSAKGQFHFANRVYSVGAAHRFQYVTITFDLETRQFVVHAQTGEEIKRLSADWLSEARIRGLPEYEVVKEQPAT
ncbi:MAG: helix-turn-helix domain-containing protein [Anaerolineales bacterium]|nr:helix-turn-helix domain-containing protein [Anaerolineales bacterium]